MTLSLTHWRPRHLFAAWGAYWLGLIGITLGPAIAAAIPIVTGPEGKGSISANAGDQGVSLTILEGTRTVWTGTTPFTTMMLWLTVPPLVLWLLWIAMRPRPSAERGVAAGAADVTLAPGALADASRAAPRALPEPAARTIPVRQPEREAVRESIPESRER